MRSMTAAVLSAMLLLGCSDDDDDGSDDKARDGAVRDAATGGDGGSGGGNLDAGPVDAGPSIDAGRDASADGGPDSGVLSRASATLASKSGSMVTGAAVFSRTNSQITLLLDLAGAEPGMRGVHIHAKGDCSAADASSAGDHWNPDMHMHGAGDSTASHLGDLGNIMIGQDGKGSLTIAKPEWTLGDKSVTDVIGKAIVVHRNTDDLTTQAQADAGITPGNSGARVACGVITAD